MARREQIEEVFEDTQKGKHLIFLLDNEYFGIEIKYVTEIIGVQSITAVPGQSHYVKGIINLRGKIIPVIDVRILFHRKEKAYDDRTCTVVIEIGEVCIGLIVDRVSEVVLMAEGDIVAAPQVSGEKQNRFIKKIGKVGNEVRLLIDCEKLLDENELESLEKLA